MSVTDLIDIVVNNMSPIEDIFEEMEIESPTHPVSNRLNENLEERGVRLLAQIREREIERERVERRERQMAERRELLRQIPNQSANIFAPGEVSDFPTPPRLHRTSRYIPGGVIRPPPAYIRPPRGRRQETNMLGTPRGITRRRLNRGNRINGGKCRRKTPRK